MKKLYKPFVSLMISLVFFMQLLQPGIIAAENTTLWQSGILSLAYDLGDDVVIEIDGIQFEKAPSEFNLEISYNASSVDNKNNSFFINGEFAGYLADKDNTLVIESSLLKDGDNELVIRLTDNDKVYEEEWVYGRYNLDDLEINKISAATTSGAVVGLSEIIKYMPIPGASGVNPQKSVYNGEKVAVGDGWDTATKLGGSTPNTPVMVGFVFEIDLKKLGSIYAVDTTGLADGEKTIKFYNKTTKSYLDNTETIYIDNNSPEIKFTAGGGGTADREEGIKLTLSDNASGIKTVEIYLDEKLEKSVSENSDAILDIKNLRTGSHTLKIYCEDNKGNSDIVFYIFDITEKSSPSVTVNKGKTEGSEEMTFYGAELVKNINMYENPYGGFDYKFLRNSREGLVQFNDMENIQTVSGGSGNPYQSFVVDVTGVTGEAVVTYSGETGSGGDIILSAWNYSNGQWDDIMQAKSGAAVSFTADLSVYAKNGSMRVNARPYIAGNGSDTILWHTDTQYYSRYEDLNAFYESIMNYAVEEYRKNNIAYVLYTGDFVDQSDNDEVAIPQYEFASSMQKILDDAAVPNGVVSGNHDVRHTTLYYNYYNRYFPASRYASFEWYGGTLSDNIHHYDLITVGCYDFIILYLGYGLETADETVAWANTVLEKYSDRNAIIATHEYLSPDGRWSGTNASGIWNKIVVPNENVKMIVCGHNEGACDQLRQVGDSDRYVLEILHDYQFADMNDPAKHIENKMTCNGEGFLRMMRFTEDSQMIMSTYSPYHEMNNYYAYYTDNYVYDVDLIKTKRSIKTNTFIVGVNSKQLVNASAEGYAGVYGTTPDDRISPIYTEKSGANKYDVPSERIPYESQSDYVNHVWNKKVGSTLRRAKYGAAAGVVESGLYELGVNLIPADSSSITKTYGSEDYFANIVDGVMKYGYEGTLTWMTLNSKIESDKSIYEYNNIYFSISSPDSHKWNIIINTTAGKYSFSQGLYENFGYESFNIPSDITGSWYGRISLEGLVKEGERVTSVDFVLATKNSEVTVNYLFMGKNIGVESLFTAGDDYNVTIDTVKDNAVNAPEAPYKEGYVFECWTDTEGTRVDFPVIANNNAVYTAKYKEKGQMNETEFFNDEVAFAAVIEEFKPENIKSGDSYLKYIIIACAVLLVVPFIILFINRKLKKNKNK